MNAGYLLDGLDILDTYNIRVMKVDGLYDFLERKGKTAHNWEDEDGEEEYVDSNDIYFLPRDITIKCYIRVSSRNDLLTSLDAFKLVLQSAGLHTFKVPYMSINYNIYFKDGGKVDIQSKWAENQAHVVIGVFTIRLREPNPLLTYY